MPSDDTLKWTSVAVGAVLVEKVLVIALESASGPVRLSMSTLLMYSTLHAAQRQTDRSLNSPITNYRSVCSTFYTVHSTEWPDKNGFKNYPKFLP